MHDRKSVTQLTRAFFFLVFVLSVPFWLVDSVAAPFLQNEIPVDLPASALQAVTPLLAALILVYVEDGSEGMRELLKRAFDYRRIRSKAWYMPALCLWPAAMLLEYGHMYLTGAQPPDTPRHSSALPIWKLIRPPMSWFCCKD